MLGTIKRCANKRIVLNRIISVRKEYVKPFNCVNKTISISKLETTSLWANKCLSSNGIITVSSNNLNHLTVCKQQKYLIVLQTD